MDRRDLSRILLGSAAAAVALSSRAQATCSGTATPDYPGQTPAESAAHVTPTCTKYPPGDVRRYGAQGDGVADDYSAINDAIQVAKQALQGMVFLPRGTYLTSSPLVIDGPVRLVGESCYGTVLKGIGITGYVLSLVGVNFAEVSNLTLHGNDGTTTDLLQFNNAAQSVVRDVLIQNARNGIVLTGTSWSNLCERVIHNGHLTGTGLTFSSCHGAQYTFTGCTFGGSYGFAIAGTASLEAIVFHNCNFEACTVQVGWITGDNVMGVSFNGCNFESSGSPIDIRPLSSGGSVCGLVFQGCTFDGNYTGGTQAYAISLGGASGVVRGFAVIGCYAENFSSWFVRLNGDGQSGIVSGNRLHSMGGSAAVVNTVRSGVLVVNNEIDGVNSGAAWNPPLTTPSYSVSGVTTPTRSYSVGTTNVTQLATVLGTLIADLQAIGLIS